ncbi:MAG TPA: transglycosylase SLT domain-containing protein [Polyangia bacterium]|nr:transglycosylase SLT domain-containing protein [Polyangia bacterium]
MGSLAWSSTDARAGTTGGKASGATPSAGVGKKAVEPPPPTEESQSERRAVRGVAVDDVNESPELRELKRFEEDAFPRNRAEAEEPGSWDVPSEVPPSLPGRWEGSGDVPEVLRSPEGARARTAPPAPDSEWLRSLKLPEIPVRWDPQVLRYLDYFKNDQRGHAIMANWLRRAGRYQALIEAALVREGLPKDLLYVAMVESGFETGARSRVGAGGIWQFMPGAARAYGLEVGYWVDARRDPERSAEAAARYLKDLYVRFNSWPLVFAAYNAGYGAVLKSITRYNTNDYWELCRHEAGLPWESSLYVPKILAAAIVGHNVEAFGFVGVVPDPPFAFEKVEVPAGTTLGTVARAAKARPDVIDALNPQITRDRTPPDRGTFSVRIPVGTAATFAEAFERTRTTGDRMDTVTLRFGETLDDVAKARGTSARELRRLNGVKDSGELRAGVAIVVPRKKGDKGDLAKTATQPARDGSNEGGEVASEDDDILVAVPDRVFNYEGRERVFYRTRDGDTLDAIAEVFGVRADDLIQWNNLDAEAKLHPKMVLQVFVRKDFDPTEVVLLDVARVKVVTLGSEEFLQLEAARRGKRRLIIETKNGDTLAKLGRRYGLTVGDLARINRFSYNTELHEGQKVVVYSPVGEPTRDVAQGMAAPLRRERGGHDNARAGVGAGVTKVVAKADAKPAGKTEPRAEGKQPAKLATKTVESSAKRTGADKAARADAKVERPTSPPKFVPKKK